MVILDAAALTSLSTSKVAKVVIGKYLPRVAMYFQGLFAFIALPHYENNLLSMIFNSTFF